MGLRIGRSHGAHAIARVSHSSIVFREQKNWCRALKNTRICNEGKVSGTALTDRHRKP